VGIWAIVYIQESSPLCLQTFRPLYACLKLCSAIVHFIWNNCFCFVCYGWAAQILIVLATLPISVVWWKCCTSSKAAVVKIEASRHLIMSQQGKTKTKICCSSIHNKNRKFSWVLYAHSQFLCSLARLDLANWGVRQTVQRHTFCAPLLVSDKTLPQPHFALK